MGSARVTPQLSFAKCELDVFISINIRYGLLEQHKSRRIVWAYNANALKKIRLEFHQLQNLSQIGAQQTADAGKNAKLNLGYKN